MSLAENRHHRERLKAKRRFQWGRDLRGNPRQLGMAVATPQPCSCLACGNARKWMGESMQERRSAECLREKDLGF